MFTPNLMELVICLIPVVILIVIAIIVINAVRRKSSKTTDINLQADSQTSNSIDNVSNVSTPIETAVNSKNGLATAGFFFSILAIIIHLLLGTIWSNFVGFLAMIMGATALLQIRKQGGRGKGMAIAGIAIGSLPFIITIVTILLISVDAVLSK